MPTLGLFFFSDFWDCFFRITGIIPVIPLSIFNNSDISNLIDMDQWIIPMALFFRDDSSGFLGVFFVGLLICRMCPTMMFDNRIVYSGLI